MTALEDLGFRLSDDLRHPGTVRPAAAEELVRAAVSQILLEDPPYELQLNQGENGEFLLNRGTGGRLLPDSEAAQEVVNGVLDSMISSQQGQALRQAHHRAAEQAGSLREALELIRASYYLPGTCRACRRYGGI